VEWLFSQTSGGNKETIHPDVNKSQGGSKSERERSRVPLPKGDPSIGAVKKVKGGSTNAVKPQTRDTRRETGKKSDANTKKGKDTDQTNPAGPGRR
jgi:hypothetical protein